MLRAGQLEGEPGQKGQEHRPQRQVGPADVTARGQHRHRALLDVPLDEDRVSGAVEPGHYPALAGGLDVETYVLVDQHRLIQRHRLDQVAQGRMLLVKEADTPTVAVVAGLGSADIQQRGGQQLPPGLVVHLVVGDRIDVVAANPDHVSAAGHVAAEPLGREGIQRRQVHTVDQRVLRQRLAEQIVHDQAGSADGPTAGPSGGQSLLHVESVVQVGDLVPLGLDDRHRDALVDLHAEEPAIVELGAVLARDAHFPLVQATPVKDELKVVLQPTVGRKAQLLAGLYLGAVNVKLQQRLLRNRRAVREFYGCLNRQTSHGHGRFQVDAGNRNVRFWGPIAVDEDNRHLASLLFVGREIVTTGTALIVVSLPFEPLPGEFLHVGDNVDLLVGRVGPGQGLSSVLEFKGQVGRLIADVDLVQQLADVRLGVFQSP